MQLASIVSERFGFKIPGGYVRMAEAGLLWANVPKTKRTGKASYTRPRALAGCDLDWLAAEEIVARLEKHGGRLRPRWPADFVFIPFAESEDGEWGWAPSLGEPGVVEPPILFIPSESADARIVAPSFSTFLFRMTLESLAQCTHDPKHMVLGERVAMLRGSTRAVLDFLPAELSARLDRVLDLPIRKVTVRTLKEKDGKFFRTADNTYLSLVGADWASRIIREELEDPRIDQPLRVD